MAKCFDGLEQVAQKILIALLIMTRSNGVETLKEIYKMSAMLNLMLKRSDDLSIVHSQEDGYITPTY